MTQGLSRMGWGRAGWRRGANTAQSASPPQCQILGQGQARQLEVSGDLWAWLPLGGPVQAAGEGDTGSHLLRVWPVPGSVLSHRLSHSLQEHGDIWENPKMEEL